MKLFILLLLLGAFCFAAPQPGDVFREYTWWKTDGDAGGALRVGGREGTTDWGTDIVNGHWETKWIDPGHDIDLKHATKAELVVEKILCHDGTTGLSIKINDSNWIDIPTPATIPEPQAMYLHHVYPHVAIPLNILNEGKNNEFKMRVDTEQSWNWPQNLIYGVHFRIYYNGDKKNHPTGKITSPQSGDALGTEVNIMADASSPSGDIQQIDFIGLYEGVNVEGDGVYRQWHYHFFHGEITHHIGSDKTPPFSTTWQTDWIPDQQKPMRIAARIIDESGMITFTEPVTDLSFHRTDFSVELCKPYDQPQVWVTRSGEFSEKVKIHGDIDNAVSYQLAWTSWSPGYMNGLYVNETKVFEKEGPKYQYFAHRLTFDDPSPLSAGVNTIKTGKTPKIDGHMVHGMEVQWPGIMLLVKYDKSIDTSVDDGQNHSIEELVLDNYPNPFNNSTMINYQLSESDDICLSINNVIGQKVITLVDTHQGAGRHQLFWNGKNDAGRNVSSGVYLINVVSNSAAATRKVTLLE